MALYDVTIHALIRSQDGDYAKRIIDALTDQVNHASVGVEIIYGSSQELGNSTAKKKYFDALGELEERDEPDTD